MVEKREDQDMKKSDVAEPSEDLPLSPLGSSESNGQTPDLQEPLPTQVPQPAFLECCCSNTARVGALVGLV